MSRKAFTLADLPERYQQQAQAQLATNKGAPDSASALDIPVAVAAPRPSPMNGLETRYSQWLEASEQVIAWRFEALKLRLGEKVFYTPDFLVLVSGGWLELHETKGYWQEDARVKIKTAATLHPWFRFVAVQEKDGTFVFERFNPR